MKENIWVFGARAGQKFDDNSKHFFLYVTTYYPDIRAVWITRNNVIKEKLEAMGYEVYLEESIEGKNAIQKAKFAFINIIYNDISKKYLTPQTNVVQLWHGTPMKYNNIAQFNEKYALVSLASLEFLTTQELGPWELFNFKITGYPRNDYILGRQQICLLGEEKKKHLKEKKVVGFFPTYNEAKDLNKQGDQRGKAYDIWAGLDIQELDQFLIQNNALFLFKPHALQTVELDEVVYHMQESPNFMLIDDNDPFTDIYEYLGYVDIMITDYSSILFDYLLLDRPVCFAAFNLEEYVQKRSLRFDYNQITPGQKCQSWSDVIKELTNLLVYKKDAYALQRKVVNHMFNYFKDANSSLRIYKELIKLTSSTK